ncbi:MAG TPA: VWA domain-containing protein, partial [Anaerolineae bacterium]|nr:VWA domain-containing protein [Anaerolineae bacterium]
MGSRPLDGPEASFLLDSFFGQLEHSRPNVTGYFGARDSRALNITSLLTGYHHRCHRSFALLGGHTMFKRFGQRQARFLIVFVLLLTLPTVMASAQGPGVEVNIYRVDTSAFPSMRIFTVPLSEGKVVPGLAQADFRVYEDDISREVTGVSQERMGTQVAIVLDASGSFKLAGTTDPDKTRMNEAIDAIDELILNKNELWLDLNNRTDKVMLMAPTSATELEVVQEWTDAYTAIHNAAYPLQPVSSDTPLLKMLQEAMKRMKDIPDYRERAKFLLVFSDGVDRISAQDITDVLRKANNLGVVILSVKMGPATAGQAKNLQRLA